MDADRESPEAPDVNSPNFEAPDSNTNSADFDALTRQHQNTVYRQMLRVCGNREDAEDVLVEALLKAYWHLDQLRDSAGPLFHNRT
jgi:DNA-directed RNA polymerase specialized sigma24 family protein